MNDNKMTIHRGLGEIKKLKAKITKAVGIFQPVAIHQKGKKINNIYEVDTFKDLAKSDYQKITDLIDRLLKIKFAIVQVNSITKINIAGQEMTIAEAISFKELIHFRKILSNRLEVTWEHHSGQLNTSNEKVNQDALEIASHVAGREATQRKDENAVQIEQTYKQANQWDIVDPIKAEKLWKETEDTINDFETEVDAKLSEINATTFIEI